MKLSSFGETTRSALEEIFKKARIAEIVDIHNPVDLTPMAGDDAYDGAFRMALFDPDSDLGIVGNRAAHWDDEFSSGEPVCPQRRYHTGRFARAEVRQAGRRNRKPFVAVVDAGPLYDPLCELEKLEFVVFRTADRALKMLELWRKSPARRAE